MGYLWISPVLAIIVCAAFLVAIALTSRYNVQKERGPFIVGFPPIVESNTKYGYTIPLKSGRRLFSSTLYADGTTTYIIDGVPVQSDVMDENDVMECVKKIAEFYAGVMADWPPAQRAI